jgi:cyclopropane-fatty-acyl-phospholipid synthase
MLNILVHLAEAGWLPDRSIRWGIRRLLAERLRQAQSAGPAADAEQRLAAELRDGPMVVHAVEANRQHYEVPAEFFQRVLGPQLKYSCGYWPSEQSTLAEAEEAMLQLTAERAALADGQRILELGCGWGSLSLWMAAHYPQSPITAVSNSHSQKRFIRQQATQCQLDNLQVITADIAGFQPSSRFDRVVSVEMFEHVRNHDLLMRRIASWLEPAGSLFVHIFSHRELTYLFQTEGRGDWMGRHFFTGGMMPSAHWLTQFTEQLQLEEQWQVNGRHYQRTCEAWLQRLDAQRAELTRLLRQQLPLRLARQQLNRWRIFLMACAELFGFRDGEEWFVSHYRFGKIED